MTYEKLSAPFLTDFPDEWYQYNLNDHFWFEWRLRILRNLLFDNALPTGAALRGLEIGCGVAFFRLQAESITQWTVDAADLNEPALQKAAASLGRTLLYNIEDRHASLKEHYDVIFLFDVLEHISDPGKFLEAALWHLKKGGFLVINVPALQPLYSRYDELVGHFVRYDSGSMRRLLQLPSHGLEILDLRYWGLSLVPVAWLRKIILRASPTPQHAVNKGFKTSRFINFIFRAQMRIETFLLRHPPAGTSLMVLARKRGT